MSAEPIDPAVKAEHEGHHEVHFVEDLPHDCCTCGLPEYAAHRCLPYRLAVEVERLAGELAVEKAKKPVRVSIEDTGPVLEAIAAGSLGGWDLLKPAEQAQYKQVVLDYIWPGLTVLVDMVNAALADQPEQVQP